MNRLKGYTVIEMLVVMLVSTLSIGISYSCYMIFSNQYRLYTKNANELSELVLLDRLLTQDITNSKFIARTTEGFECVASDKTIHYRMLDSCTIREAGRLDTFRYKQLEEPVYKRSGQTENIPGAWLNQVQLTFVYKEEKLYFYYTKLYGADLLMNQDETTTISQ